MQLFLGAIAAGPEIENLRVAGVDAQRAGGLPALRPDVREIIVEAGVAMRKALELLKGDGVGPQQTDGASVGADGALRLIASFCRPAMIG